jgi:hypothetical protein
MDIEDFDIVLVIAHFTAHWIRQYGVLEFISNQSCFVVLNKYYGITELDGIA